MNKNGILFCFLLLAGSRGLAQQGVGWLKCVGGSGQDLFYKTAITRSGIILNIGNSQSNDGDATGNHGTTDVILSALSQNGTSLWNKMIGGSNWDGVNAVDVDTLVDGNFVVGFSTASNNGDISGNHGLTDFVFRKYTAGGTLIWSKTIGGNDEEDLDQLKATADGGLIAIGSTKSNNNGDVGPKHGTNTYDMWVVKLDALGNIQWQKCLGGAMDEIAGSIFPASGGGYYFASGTNSSDGDLSGLVPGGTNIGSSDIWFGKLDGSGNIVWSKQIGGSITDDYPVIHEKNNALYLTFKSNSSDRDIPVNIGHFDAALFKYSSAGLLIWKQIYGSLSFDQAVALDFHSNGALYMSANCWSTSFAGFPVFNPGDNQILLMKVDTLTGTLNGIRSIGGSLRDFCGDVKISASGDIFMSGSTISADYGINGNHGDFDGLIFKVAKSNLIQGIVFTDKNNNGVFDPATDQRMSYIPVETNKQGIVQGVSVSNNGSYSIEVDIGTFSTKPKIYHSSYFTSIPDSFQCSFTGTPQFFNKDIQLRAVPGIRDLSVYTAPVSPARPAFHTTYLLLGQNLGTDTVAAGTMTWKKDPRVTITNFSIPPSAIFGDSIVWNFSNLRPLDSIRVYINVNTPPPPALNAGDTLKYAARIFPTAGDAYITDNTLFLFNIVTGPLDPNEKINLHGNKMTLTEVQSGTFINYVIYFQNVGTAPAFDVIINDTISSKLQLSTLQSLASSHPFSAEIKGNIVQWKFLNINLPDSTSNEPGSHGFIAFRIRPITTLSVGDSIVNRAGIYFDYNAAVVTSPNVVKIVANNVVTALPGGPSEEKDLALFPNPLEGAILYLVNKNPNRRYKQWRLINQLGVVVLEGKFSSAFQTTQLLIPGHLQTGIYYLELEDGKQKGYKRVMIMR